MPRKRKSDLHEFSLLPRSASRRLQLINEQERTKITSTPVRAHRSRGVVVEPVKTLGWFGDGDNGHWHIDGLMESKSYYSAQGFADALAQQSFVHVSLFEITDIAFADGLNAFMENVGMQLCNQSMQFWTSFFLREGANGRRWPMSKYRSFFGIATMSASEMLFLLLATPSIFTEKRVDLEAITY